MHGNQSESTDTATRTGITRPVMANLASPLSAHYTAPTLIAVGLGILLAHNVLPVLPVATALALIAFGASTATILRRACRATVAGQLLVYVSLYLLFVVAICDASGRVSENGLSLLQVADLGLSVGIMAFVARTCMAAIDRNGDHLAH
jgi:hypothetical protein